MNLAKSKLSINAWKINRPFLILSLGRLISQFGDKLYLLALPWLVLELTHSALYSSITFALETIPAVLLAPFIGVYVDRKTRKGVMIGADFIRGLVIGAITLLSFTGKIEMVYIYIGAFLLSALTLLFDSASEGYLPKIVAKEKLVEANANLTFINTLMRLVGPPVAGISIAMIGADGTIGINAVSFFLSGIILIFLPQDTMAVEIGKKVKTIIKDIKEGFSYLFNHQTLFPIAVFSTFMNIGIFMVTTLIIFESKETLGYGPKETSLIFWISGFFATITTLLIKPLKKIMDKGQMIRYGSIGVLIAILILVFDQSLITITASYSLILMVGIIVNVNMMAYRQEIIPNHLFGRVMTSSRVLVNAFAPLAMVLAGWLANKYNAVIVFELASVIVFFNVLYAWFSKLKYIK